MNQGIATDKTTRVLLLIAAAFVAVAFGLWGQARGVAALVGAVVSVVNWLALRWLTGRIVDPEAGPSKAAMSLLLVAKIGVLMALVYILIQRLHLDPIGLAFGLGVLFIGPVIANLAGAGRSSSGGGASPLPAPNGRSAPSGARQVNSSHPSAGSTAREER